MGFSIRHAVARGTSSIWGMALCRGLRWRTCRRWCSLCGNTSQRRRSMSDAVLLLAHGTPDRVEEIPEYLSRVTQGRPLPPAVVEEVSHRFSIIGGSPLTPLTLEQGRLLQQEIGVPVYVGMRNWKPYIADVVQQMRADGVTRAVVICLAPQNSRTSVGLYRAAVMKNEPSFTIEFVESWHDHPL